MSQTAVPRYVIYQGIRRRTQAPFWCVLDTRKHGWHPRQQQVSIRFTTRASAERCMKILIEDDARTGHGR